ncbi:hypothetical protein BCR41DRAFT_345955 [Lobosporangium transversale]|uniref:Uncharacterized protein n=1 Tax=Lobosporangium transversale TaxID=64571 RepID=A0A1Y2H193_9FUNG|nr:hypothetical protein BCR41DRAFT_345955 [Lobosporangium transversale]ORZ27814.1 hypothetical protein BCR41DRAFT_345955 [Lobosporangium transversale]|eukprot:XP_021885517.1 hypothetical protein BCR41DRAFT_345955 [Lobosporangium transversale]
MAGIVCVSTHFLQLLVFMLFLFAWVSLMTFDENECTNAMDPIYFIIIIFPFAHRFLISWVMYQCLKAK